MSENQPTQLVPASQPTAAEPVQLAGYTLENRLGTGGYGEVWRAIGPGGLPKAVKILFGQMDGPQADAELKSLNRMRDLRHPFLLSIERIEVVDGRLVVVTELADGCLDDRFNELRADGQRGIPRDELLGYLRDAADALDFMFEEHGLQHLDIKPENLMLQGKHVKVGDFGLAKDVNSTNISLVGGFTPLYGPPEIYEGQPSRASDQYSLAIVYQVMLTGIPPFAGRSAAQLTAQHLRSTPDLSSLQPVDRPVIARALSKNPNARFSNSRQFVDELNRRRNSRSRARVRVAESGESVSCATRPVEKMDLAANCDVEARQTEPLRPLVESLPLQHRPTLYIGVGGLGGEVLRTIKTEFARKFGTDNHGAFSMLYLDTSRAAVEDMRSRSEIPLAEDELLPIPLRTSNEYRRDERLKLGWLSRRWLFNLPKTGEVDGIRPLARLALIDHEVKIRKTLSDVITRTTSHDSIAEAAESLGLFLDPGQLDIIVVGSISGGSSSGSIIDVAAMARAAAAECGVETTQVHGFLMHATSTQRQMGDIQDANAMSCLRELLHYRTPSLGESDPFDSVYVVHLGDSLAATEFRSRTNRVADYLFRSSATDARKWIDSWRQSESETSNSPSAIRTFGIASVEDSVYRLVSRESQSLAYAISHYWAGSQNSDTADHTDGQQLLKQLGLTESRLSNHVLGILRGELGREIDAYAEARLSEFSASGTQATSEVLQQIESGFENDDRVKRILLRVMGTFPNDKAGVISRLREHVVSMLDRPCRVNGAAAEAGELRRQLESSAVACRKLQQEIEEGFEALRGAITSATDTAGQDTRKLHHQYCVLRFYRAIYLLFVDYVEAILDDITKMDGQLREFRVRMRSFAQSIVTNGEVPTSQPDVVVAALDGQILTSSRFHLSDLFAGEVSDAAAQAEILGEASAFLLANAGRTDGGDTKSGFPQSATPELANVGGMRRVLGMLPATADSREWKAKLEEHFGDCVTIEGSNQASELSVLCEIQGISIEQVLSNFEHKSPRLVEVSRRVHTRIDIDW